ncbi:MAG: beta strand repeat-containing protein [Gemmatimonadota bacterium]
MQKLSRSLIAFGGLAVLAACGDDVSVTPPAVIPITIQSVTVAPATVTISVGERVILSASVATSAGTGTAPATTVTWSSANAAIATVVATGEVTGFAVGTTTIRATSTADPSKVGAAAVTVTSGVTSVAVTPQNVSINVGASVTAVATVTRGTTATSGGVTWTTSNAAIATVGSTTGVITGVTVGTAVITATSTADASKAASLTVTVTPQPVALTSLTITPTTITIGPGSSQQATAVFTAATGASVAFINNATTTCAGIATASTSTNGTTTITGVAPGSCVITVTATGSGTGLATNSIQQAIAINIVAAQVSIRDITFVPTGGGPSIPVPLSNVAGQIEVNLNFQPNSLPIDSVVVSIQQPARPGAPSPRTAGGFVRAAQQIYNGATPAAGILSLSINTANYTKNATTGTTIVDFVNGQTTIRAQVFPRNSSGGAAVNCSNSPNDPNCSAPIQLVLNNVDGWAADITKPAASAVNIGGAAATLGSTYWGGPGAANVTTATLFPVIYNNNPSASVGSTLNRCSNGQGDGTGCISTVTWTVGAAGFGTCALLTQTALPFRTTFGTSGTTACVYQNTTIMRDNVIVTASIDGTNNPFVLTPLIANTVVFASTPDSLRVDYVGPGTVVTPQVGGAEGFNWVNHIWPFTPAGTKVADGGVGPLESSWAAFASANGGSTTTFPTPVTTGADLAETNQNCTGVGCDGYNARASATDRLANASNSGVSAAFGDDRTSPVLRYSATAAPSSFAAIYTGGGSASVLDSTTYNAIQGIYGVNVTTAGAQTLFLAAAAGANDSVRVDGLDNRSGLSRVIATTRRFAQGGTTGATTTVSSTTAGLFGPGLVDGFRPSVAFHITNGIVGGAPPVTAGYYTTTQYAVDRAGNVSGCPVTGSIAGAVVGTVASVCTAAAPSTADYTNPAMQTTGPAGRNANLFVRRTLALDPVQPQVTGVSPNNAYTGNSVQTWALGSQDDLEVIDARLRISYPNVTVGDVAGTIPGGGTGGGLVWSYALSNTFMASAAGLSAGPFSAGPASGSGVNFGYFAPIAMRFDASIINPQVTTLTQDMFTLNVQETCTAAAAAFGAATGPATATDCGTATRPAVGDPITFATAGPGILLARPDSLGVQVRDVFGSWIFNQTAGPAFGVATEFASPILSSTVAAPGGYSVTYSVVGPGCPQGGAGVGGPCVTGGVNFRHDGGTGTVRNFRAVEALSVTLPIFVRVELYGLNAAGEWVFIQRCAVPSTIAPNVGPQACTTGGGTVTGTDNGLERYWVYSFTGIPTLPAGFTSFRALGVNSQGFGLFSTIQP